MIWPTLKPKRALLVAPQRTSWLFWKLRAVATAQLQRWPPIRWRASGWQRALAIAADLPSETDAILSELAQRITYKLDGYQ